jgi:hypothetical protein
VKILGAPVGNWLSKVVFKPLFEIEKPKFMGHFPKKGANRTDGSQARDLVWESQISWTFIFITGSFPGFGMDVHPDVDNMAAPSPF